MGRSVIYWSTAAVAVVLLTACKKQSEETPPGGDVSVTEEPQQAAAGHTFTASLTGAEEVPGPGDEDGAGTFRLTHSEGATELCYELTVQNIDPANAAHVHSGARGQAGAPVVMLEAPAQGSSKACSAVESQALQDIIANPGNYYVNVHNPAFPAGAIRGQLAAAE